jgi:hypothetical protein
LTDFENGGSFAAVIKAALVFGKISGVLKTSEVYNFKACVGSNLCFPFLDEDIPKIEWRIEK